MPADHIQSLFQYIKFAPKKWQIKYNSGIRRYNTIEIDKLKADGTPKKKSSGNYDTTTKITDNPEWMANKTNEASFNGILFREDRVLVMNIYTFNPDKDYEISYLDITGFFNRMLQQYNIFHLCLIIPKALRGLYSDSTLTENLIPFIKYDKPYRLPKRRYALTRHHNKHRKFIVRNRRECRETWDPILHQAISKISNLSTFGSQRNERHASLWFDYSQEPELHIRKNNGEPLYDLPPKGERKARRRFGAKGT
jgi:hypothetical protein